MFEPVNKSFVKKSWPPGFEFEREISLPELKENYLLRFRKKVGSKK